MDSVAVPNLFVVFEGIDGSGKTTLSNRVAARLRARGLSVAHVREHGRFASSVTQSIRELGRDPKNLAMTPRAEMLLAAAREAQLLEEATLPAMLASDVVLADRFLYTVEVLAEHGRGLPAAEVRQLMAAVGRGVEPDLVVLMDLDPQLARARRRASKVVARESSPPSRKGLAGVGIQHRLRDGYRALAARDPRRWILIDNSDASLDTVESAVVDGILVARAQGVEHGREVLCARLAQGSGPVAATARTVIEARQRFLEWIDRRADGEPSVAAYLLGGLLGPEIDERRRALATRAPEVVAHGLRHVDDVVSWQLRRELAPVAPRQVAASLAGVDTRRKDGRTLRWQLVDRAPAEIGRSLTSYDDAFSWDLRAELRPVAPLAVLASLAGLAAPHAWAWRDGIAEELGSPDTLETSYVVADAMCESLAGLDDERAWKLRALGYRAAPVSAIHSLVGLTSDRAHEWRERHLACAPKAVMKSLLGLDDERSFHLRGRVAGTCKEALKSIVGLDGAEAWHLRERCLDVWPQAVAESIGPVLARRPRGAALLEELLSRHAGVPLWRAVAAVTGGTGDR